jgi:hypothetical protein
VPSPSPFGKKLANEYLKPAVESISLISSLLTFIITFLSDYLQQHRRSKMTTFLTKYQLFGISVTDGLVIVSSCSCLVFLQKLLYMKLQRRCPSLSDAHLEIFSTETALIPTRVLMVTLNLPGLAYTISNKIAWLPIYSDMAAWSW